MAHMIECPHCGDEIMMSPVWFIQKETDDYGQPTGRARKAVDYYLCDICGERVMSDSSEEPEPWQREEEFY